MAPLSHILLSSLLVITASAGSAVIDLIPGNFDKIVLKSNKPALVEFFAPWCGHCKTLAPIYEQLGQNFAFAENKVSIAKVDADENRDLGKRFGVQGFPTLKWFDGKSDKPEEYSGGRDLESLQSFITEKTGLRPRVKKGPPSHVESLTDETFKKEIGGDKDVLVAFTAPWCGHCKALTPIWETLATDFALEPTVIIGKVDAEAPNAKATAKEQGVSSYPTIKYFSKGSKVPEDYTGGRNEDAFIAFINEKAGTNRAVGGGLNSKAGTIETLDSIVTRFTGGATIESLTKELQKTAKAAKVKYADYYVKVFNKLSSNSGYAQKELSRLDNILKKGGLAPEKRDDITVRKNILSRFIAEKLSKDDL
ncbi:MAG: hypothetical protein M1814_003073 [Vezdaea aestivalis]|nr:MAG: hypothetical protein M1814_003073 [Vezdaea aestivalis]